MHSMRIFRNKNAHNEDTSQNDNARLLKQARSLCKWLVKNNSPEHNKSSRTRISITDIMKEYRQDAFSAGRKYDGRALTLTGGKILKVTQSGYGNNSLVVSLLSPPAETDSGMTSTTYKVDCYFPESLKYKIDTLKPGQSFTATGTWENRRLINCVWEAGCKKHREHGSREWSDKDALFVLALIIVIIGLIYQFITGGL